MLCYLGDVNMWSKEDLLWLARTPATPTGPHTFYSPPPYTMPIFPVERFKKDHSYILLRVEAGNLVGRTRRPYPPDPDYEPTTLLEDFLFSLLKASAARKDAPFRPNTNTGVMDVLEGEVVASERTVAKLLSTHEGHPVLKQARVRTLFKIWEKRGWIERVPPKKKGDSSKWRFPTCERSPSVDYRVESEQAYRKRMRREFESEVRTAVQREEEQAPRFDPDSLPF